MTCRITLLLALGAFVPACAEKPPPAQPSANVTLHTTDAAGLVQSLERHRGQIVLVDFWATWCGPCRELFPHALELERRFGDRGLTVLTVSLDDPDDQAAVSRFLAKNPRVAENYLSSYGVGPAAFLAFGITDGALPHAKLYDRNGRLRKTFASSGKPLNGEDIERAVEELVESAGQ